MLVSRRAALSVPLVGLIGCTDVNAPPKQFGPPPWHMWGTLQDSQLNGVAAVSSDVQLPQLVRVNYGRPETWTFLLWVQLNSATADVPVAVNFDFNFLIGLGRAPATIVPFKRVVFPIADTTAANINAVHPFRFATRVQVPLLDPTDAVPNLVEWFPAQDIQIGARATSTGSIGAGNILRFQMGAWVAPRSHMRPDWFNEDNTQQFRGEEQAGT